MRISLQTKKPYRSGLAYKFPLWLVMLRAFGHDLLNTNNPTSNLIRTHRPQHTTPAAMLRAVTLATFAACTQAAYHNMKGSDDRIVPDVINRYGNVKLNIVVTSHDKTRSLPLVKGMHIMPDFVSLPPKIEWYCKPTEWFTMVLTGPDNPSRGVRRRACTVPHACRPTDNCRWLRLHTRPTRCPRARNIHAGLQGHSTHCKWLIRCRYCTAGARCGAHR